MPQTRGERKEQTRRAVLDAALQLSTDSTLAALSLRQIAREVGIVPTAFYRHFASLEDLGLVLVEESLDNLRTLLREWRRGAGQESTTMIDGSVTVLVEQVRHHHAHYGFMARERFAGPPQVREAIAGGIALAERDLAIDLAHLPGSSQWSEADRQTLASLIVVVMVAAAEQLATARENPSAESAIAASTRAQLLMIVVGANQWHS
ncbi:MAG: TetR family transcriptional regulator [Nocardioidaceae bacterium]|nr:TetR family transcriptional regulator [Nocardioidaceae bacterium]